MISEPLGRLTRKIAEATPPNRRRLISQPVSEGTMNEIDQTIARLESELALPNGFFDALKNEEDWSFILKCHALMESACSFLLTAYFDNPNYEDIFSRLEMSNRKKGKVAFL